MDKDLQNKLENFPIESFQHDLINWYLTEKRDLPWRRDQDPYKVWVSEIMLQQTRVDTVIPYFTSFITKFPTIESLADANEEEVLKAWEGLGYYSRVRNLQSAVKEVKESYGGVVPNTPNEISKLKGVGPYTKGAILSIAYNIPEPAVDGNVMRVLSRILSIWEDIAKPKARKTFEAATYELISKEDPSSFNQALMELGALICTPTSPSCLLCPVREHCSAFEEGVQTELPIKSKKKKPKPLQMAAAVLYDQNSNLYIHKRPSSGLLAKLWEYPNVELDVTTGKTYREQLVDYLQDEYDVKVELSELAGTVEHIFSHLIWNISIYFGKVKNTPNGDLVPVTETELSKYAFPVSHQKIYQIFKESDFNV
ncbi:A/G-specific adenine glycosylase [Metabacillus rhizolycopersici]|uniref:Adenine DNA glycosylase n=1 Tax=Metabacillus rhizolycopersici TaxID=2875709 RepID=A0ABS7UT15_9BACI|nr:A/G-specific adenine glycosylase [Metabacillus rhizolycopersici]MBZ5751212.1 A/G-specific adenine glycosylase [Metabacillus rhizolycopersici]